MSAHIPAFTHDKPAANPYAERALLGSLLVLADKRDPDTAARFILDNRLSLDLFTAPTCQDLFTAITDLFTGGDAVNLPALVQRMADQAMRIEFESLRKEFVSDANLAAFVRQLRECRNKRECERLKARLITALNENDLEAVDAFRVKIEALRRDDKPTRDHHFQWAKEFCQQPAESNSLISGITDMNSTGCIVGDSQAGKSFVAIDRGCHVSNGMNWLGRKTKAGIVLYIIGEGASGTRKRIKAWHDYHGLEISDRLAIRTVPAALCNPASVNELIESVKEFLADLGEMPVLIELDTLNRNFGPGDENQTKDMTAFVAGMDALRRATGAHVSTVHHFGKGDKNSPRGSIVLESNLDFSYHVKKTGDPQQPETLVTTMTFEKAKDYQPPAPVAWRWQIQDLPWLDENGGRQTSVVLLQTDPDTRTRPDKVHIPPSQRIALESLRTALVDHGIETDEAPGVVSVADDQWRQAAYSAGISASDKPDSAQKAYSRARQELLAARLVSTQNKRYWIPAPTRTRQDKAGHCPQMSGGLGGQETGQDRTFPFRGCPDVRLVPDPTPDPTPDIEENGNVRLVPDPLQSPLAIRIREKMKFADPAGVADDELEREAGKAGAALYQQTLAALVKAHGWRRCNGRWMTGSVAP